MAPLFFAFMALYVFCAVASPALAALRSCWAAVVPGGTWLSSLACAASTADLSRVHAL